ncbi:MAG TPA: hypothetical protein VF581_13915 [Flavobacterium sp.]|jgi:hypothetical protein
MKKRYILFLLFIAATGYSQTAELRWAEKIKTKESVSVLGGKDGTYYTSHKDDDNRLIIRKYDKNLAMKSEKPLELDMDSKKKMYSGAYFVNDKIIHFIRETVRKEDKQYIYGAISDLNLNTNKKIFVLDEAEDDAMTFGVLNISPDSTKILVYNELKGRKKDPSVLNLKVYNTSFTDVLFQKTVSLPIKASKFDMTSVSVDNLGNIFVLAKIYKEKNQREKDQSLYSYKVFAFSKTAGDKEFDFDYPDRDIESIGLIPGANNTMICTGFLKILNKGMFGKGKKTLISDEVFTSVIDGNSLALKSATKFDLEGLYPEKPKKAEDYVPYKVREIFYKPDGGSVMVAEQYKLVVTTHSTPQGTTTTYRYYYCDVAVIHINSKSEVESVSKMPKYQLNAANPSILATYYNGNTYIVYEDLEKNAEASTDKETKRSSAKMFSSGSKNALMLLTVNAKGEMDKTPIFSYKDSKIRPSIRSSMVISPNEIIMNANDQIGVLKFSKS